MAEEKKSPLKEITQPFIDLVHAPRALWGINLAYVLEGMVYFGMLGYLAIYFSDFVFQGIEHADEYSHSSVMILTAGITIAMFFLGFVADRKGVRFALIFAFVLMFIGRAAMSAAPNVLGFEPARPGVFVGDKVNLHVTELDTRDGVKTISAATVLANENGTKQAVDHLAVDLSAGDGTLPDESLESKLVRVSNATLTEGEGQDWKLQYGSAQVTARLIIHSAEEVGLCAGATISLGSAYVIRHEESGEEFVIRTHWKEDVANIDTSACEEKPEPEEESNGERSLRSESRWEITEPGPAVGEAQELSVAELAALDDGPVNVVLPDVNVTYVRNGGYYLQETKEGPGIYAFVSPLWSPLHLATILGIVFVVIGYGMYQPAAYAAVRQFTTPKTAAMGFAMLYALMNLGGWLPTFAFLLRDDDFLGFGISGTYWVYTGFTFLALLVTIFILSRKTIAKAIAIAKAETEEIKKAEGKNADSDADKKKADVKATEAALADPTHAPVHLHIFVLVVIAAIFAKIADPADTVYQGVTGYLARYLHLQNTWVWIVIGCLFGGWIIFNAVAPIRRWVAIHPLSNGKFFFFIFALIPVQTLFTYNWLILPQYISRAFEGWMGKYFEIAANANPILIFIAVPLIAAATQKAKVYNMMVYGTFIMAAPAFLLVLGPHWWTLAAYIMIMTVGEAMWQPRFLQYAAEIAPEGRTGVYMGVAQLPWFLTKVLVPWLYSGTMMDRYCPAEGVQNTESMWLIFACIAMTSTVLLVIAKPWVGKDFKTKAD